MSSLEKQISRLTEAEAKTALLKAVSMFEWIRCYSCPLSNHCASYVVRGGAVCQQSLFDKFILGEVSR